MRKSMLIVLSLIPLAIYACSPGGAPAIDRDALATSVAGTLQAKGVEPKSAEQGGEAQAAPTAEAPAPATETAPPPTLPPAPRRIVYTDAGNVWLLEEGGLPQQLTTSGSAQDVFISDDGQRVVFIYEDSAAGTYELRAVDAAGSPEQVLLTQAQLDALHPLGGALHIRLAQLDFIPGSHDLLFNTRATFEGPGLAKYDDLLRLDADSGALTPLLAPGDGGDFTLSRDGTRVALVKPDSIRQADIDGSGLTAPLITFTPVMTYSEYQYYPDPVWAADGAMGVVIPPQDPLGPDPIAEVWVVSAGGSPSLMATVHAQTFFAQAFGAPLISPDLMRVVYSRDTTTPNIRNFYLANADGSGESVYVSGDVRWTGWNPTGDYLVFEQGTGNLILGQPSVPPAPFVIGTRLRWIGPDEALYTNGSFGSWTLMRVRVGEAPQLLVSPAGDFIAFDATP